MRKLQAKIDNEIKGFIDEAYNSAEKLLNDNIEKLHAVSAALLEREKLEGKEFVKIFENA